MQFDKGRKNPRCKSPRQERPDRTAFKGSLADKAVREHKLAAQQELRPKIFCEGEVLENVFKFGYLGNLFAADGLQDYDIRARIAMAMTRCGKLSHMFDSPALGGSPLAVTGPNS